MNDSGSKRRNVLIVDDHPIVRQGLRQLIDAEHDLHVSDDVESFDAAIQSLANGYPDVVVLDLSFPDRDGLELLKELRAMTRELPVLILSMHDENVYAERLLSAGANGYIMKQAAADQLLTAIRRVLAGGMYVSEDIGSSMIERFASSGVQQSANPVERLSNRELQVLNLIGSGKTTREAAESLDLSIKTVESHRQRIKKKLHLQTSAQLVQFAVSYSIH
jgi:DNA-binding NarL/FixJ family response regulator